MIINRDVINDNIVYDGYTKQDLCNKINRYKRIIKYKYGLQKGDTVCLIILRVNANHVAAAIAVAELGMKLFLTNKPIAMETVNATKMAIYGPMDLTIRSRKNGEEEWTEIDDAVVTRFSKQICYEEEIDELLTDEDIPDVIDVSPDDVYLFGSTSGTKGKSKPIYWTHKDCYLGCAVEPLFRKTLTADSVMYNTLNMHHLGSMLGYLLPALSVAETHYSVLAPFEKLDQAVEEMIEYGVDNTIFHIVYMDEVLKLIEKNKDRIKKRITFHCSGMPLTEEHYNLCKRAPINFQSTYGGVDLGGVFHIFVDENTEYIPNNLGKIVPGKSVRFDGENAYVSSDLWGGVEKVLEDYITYDCENYFFAGRKEEIPELKPVDFRPALNDSFPDWTLLYRENDKPDLVIWDHETVDFTTANLPLHMLCRKIFFLEKRQFMDTTKLSMEQLREYVENN